MEILYFLGKTSLILAIFFCGYRALMARDTFYVFNRYYLLAGLVASLLVPLLVFTQTVYVEPVSAPVIEMEQDNIADPVENIVPVSEVSMPASKDSFHFWELIFYAYLIGVLFFVGRFAFSLFGIVRFSRKHLSFKENGLRYIEISGLPAPFSFFNTIVYDPEKPTKEELNLILAHERQHARQLHSIDLLLGRLFCALFWFNPLAWFYARAIEQNLEFLADTKVADLGFPKTDYQLTLLHISAGKTPALTQSFYQSFIKKQIIMLNKNSSNPYRKLKILLMLPFLALFIYGFNIKEAIKYREATKPINTALTSDMMQKNVDSSYRYVIKKNTTKEEIDSIKAVLAEKYGAVLKVLDIDRNINGVIIEINIDVDDIGGKVTYHPKIFFGIADILISRDGDRSFGVGPLNENKTTTRMHNQDMVANSQSSGAKNYVKPYKLTIAKNASKKEIEAVLQVLKEKYNEQWTYENLTYNDDGDLITLNLIYREKEHSSSSYSYSGYGDPKGIGKIILFRNRDGTHGSVTEGEENFATLTEDYNTKSPFNKYATNPVEGKATQDAILKAQRAKIIVARRKMTKQLHEEREALLEERKQKRAQLSQQREEQIQERLKQIDSVRYFMEGKNPDGSILYNTFTTSSGSPFGSSEIPEGSVLDKIESSTTDEALEKIKHSFADKGLEITFKDLERNDKGLITNIAVSLKNRTTSGSATFNVSSDAIPDIFIGQMPINIRF